MVQTTLSPTRSVLQVPGKSSIVVGFILPLATIPLLGLDAVLLLCMRLILLLRVSGTSITAGMEVVRPILSPPSYLSVAPSMWRPGELKQVLGVPDKCAASN